MNKIIYSKDHKFLVEQLKKARIEAVLDQELIAPFPQKLTDNLSLRMQDI